MGAKSWMLVSADSDARQALSARPSLDREGSRRLAGELFPGERLEALGDVDLTDTDPPPDILHVGRFPGVSILAAREFGIDHPSRLGEPFVVPGRPGRIHLHAMHSVVDWFAFARWDDGRLVRSLSLSPDRGILEDIGPRLPFEGPYWAGTYAVQDGEDVDVDYPFPFHPLELGEAALLAFFGFQLEGRPEEMSFAPESIPLLRFRRSRSRWKFWR